MKFWTPRPAWARFKFPALGAALAVAALLLVLNAPGLALRFYLSHILPRQSGLDVAYARASLENSALFLENLTLTGPDLGRLALDLELRDFRPLVFFRSRPGLDLADLVVLRGVRWEREDWTFQAPEIKVVRPRWPVDEADMPFNLVLAQDPHGGGRPEAPQFQAKGLILGHRDLALEDLRFQLTTEAGVWTGEVKSLKLDDFQSALDRWVQSGGRPWALLPELFHLRASAGRLELDGQPVILVRTALPETRHLFTKFSPHSVSYSYFLALWLDPELLPGAFRAELGGRPLDLELALDLTFDPEGGALELRSLSLDEPNLGRLDLAAELSGLGPWGDSLHEFVGGLFPARLHSLSLAFQDQGFMAWSYARLALMEGWSEAEVPDRLKEELWASLPEAQEETGAGLFLLAGEAEAFLDHPENLIISLEPARPQVLARLVKMDGYDIIKNLGLTLTVNDRPAAPGVVSERPAPFQAEDPAPQPAPGRAPAE